MNVTSSHSHKRIRNEEESEDLELENKVYKSNDEKMYIDKNDVYAIGNEIHFTTDINQTSIQEVIKLMTKIINDNCDKNKRTKEKLVITYIVDSPGGIVSSVLKFVDFIGLVKDKYNFVEFVSIISGLTASAGTIMAIVADKRYITKHAYAMIHELHGGMIGKRTFVRSKATHMDQLHNDLVDIYMEKIKMDREKLEMLLSNETWFSAQEYLELGFVDEIKGCRDRRPSAEPIVPVVPVVPVV
jgi:ATP-dependent protease ClpP protease subunit